jgi:hypothetical protein
VTSCGLHLVKALARGDGGNGQTHIAIQEKLDGKLVDWLEHVTEEQYRSGENNTR